MTLEQIRFAGANFAVNEITGRLIQFSNTGSPDKQTLVWIEGDNSPKTFVLSLFAEKEIAKNWTPLSWHKAAKIIEARPAMSGCV